MRFQESVQQPGGGTPSRPPDRSPPTAQMQRSWSAGYAWLAPESCKLHLHRRKRGVQWACRHSCRSPDSHTPRPQIQRPLFVPKEAHVTDVFGISVAKENRKRCVWIRQVCCGYLRSLRTREFQDRSVIPISSRLWLENQSFRKKDRHEQRN